MGVLWRAGAGPVRGAGRAGGGRGALPGGLRVRRPGALLGHQLHWPGSNPCDGRQFPRGRRMARGDGRFPERPRAVVERAGPDRGPRRAKQRRAGLPAQGPERRGPRDAGHVQRERQRGRRGGEQRRRRELAQHPGADLVQLRVFELQALRGSAGPRRELVAVRRVPHQVSAVRRLAGRGGRLRLRRHHARDGVHGAGGGPGREPGPRLLGTRPGGFQPVSASGHRRE